MTPLLNSWRTLLALAVFSTACVIGTSRADDEGGKGKGKGAAVAAKGKGKGHGAAKGGPWWKGAAKGEGGAANLPPGLARKPANHPGRVAWLKAHAGKEAGAQPGKGKGAAKGKGVTANLPPGLARKPANHPGRVAWLKAHAGKEAGAQPAKEKGKGKGKGKGAEEKGGATGRRADVERRLERLLREIEELRKELRREQ